MISFPTMFLLFNITLQEKAQCKNDILRISGIKYSILVS